MKTLVGYCEPFSVAPGERVQLKMSSPEAVDCRLDLVRLRCGDPYTGLDEEVVTTPTGLPVTIPVRPQALRPGSYVLVDRHPDLDGLERFTVRVRVRASLPGGGRAQGLLGTWTEDFAEGWLLYLDGQGAAALRVGHLEATTGVPLRRNRWTEIEAGFDRGRLWVRQTALAGRSPGADLADGAGRAVEGERPSRIPGFPASGRQLLMAAWWGPDGLPNGHFDGRLEDPSIEGDGGVIAHWDFAAGIGTTAVHDRGPNGIAARTVQCPARAVTGSRWDGSTQRWTERPEQYAAIHFHHDDLVDAGWATNAELTVPAELASGVYCWRVTAPDGEVDRTPFVVRASGTSGGQADLLFLVPSATYLAYANHRMTIDGTDFFPSRNRLRPEFQYLREHPEVGLSMYEYHPDGSGVMYSSLRRPVLNLKPGADGWAFTADTNLLAFLERSGLRFDVATDEDLDRQGAALLANYRCVMTGSHPEYFSTPMLDAVEQFLSDGGRLMYLGGNGFYWRVAFHADQPGVMEVRRAEDGTRGWIAEPGEYYHEWGGEYGGLWRRLGRTPNQLVGVGFAAQGFDRAAPYKRLPASQPGGSRADWIFAGVTAPDVIGDYGVGRGAAGQEIDRYDERLGSPAHAVVLAYSDEHSEEMLRTKEELLATRPVVRDPKIRADIVFFETPNGGAVFSVGSIAWFGALAHQGYDNDIARITTNVLERFVDAAPFEPPA